MVVVKRLCKKLSLFSLPDCGGRGLYASEERKRREEKKGGKERSSGVGAVVAVKERSIDVGAIVALKERLMTKITYDTKR